MNGIGAYLNRFLKGLLTVRSLAQVFSGGLAFYGPAMIFAHFLKKGHAGIPFLLFTVFVPAAFSLFTIAWNKTSQKESHLLLIPEFNLLVGSVIFMPLYAVMATVAYENARPIAELRNDLLWLYLTLPISVWSLAVYTATIGGLVLSLVSTLVTGYSMRKE